MKKWLALERWMLMRNSDLHQWQETYHELEASLHQLPGIHRRSDVMRIWKFPDLPSTYLGLEISGAVPNEVKGVHFLDLNGLEGFMTHKKILTSLKNWNSLMEEVENTKSTFPEKMIWAMDMRLRLEEGSEVSLEYSLVFLPESEKVKRINF